MDKRPVSTTYTIDITSEIVFYDGHKESGPSTEFSGEFRTEAAFRELEKLYNRTIARLTKMPFGGRFIWELGQVMEPSDSDKATLKKFIVYTAKISAIIYFDDDTTQDFEDEDEYEVPVYNNIIKWNLTE